MAEQKQDKDSEANPLVQKWVDEVYAAKIQTASFEELQEKMFKAWNFADDVDWISSSYHLERATLIQKKGRKEVWDYCSELFKKFGMCGLFQQIKKQKINGMTVDVTVEFQVLDKDGNAFGDDSFTVVDETVTLNEKGECIRYITTSPDFDVVSLTKQQYVFKSIVENSKGTKVTIQCLDDDFNKCNFEMNKKKDNDKITQIQRIVKEGYLDKKDVMIVVVTMKTKNGKTSKIVSHAVIN